MIVNQASLLELAPISRMEEAKLVTSGVSFGLAEAGYDIRLKQEITFGMHEGEMWHQVDDHAPQAGRFTIASAIEEFDMPDCLVGVVHDKSTWARKGLSVFNTVIEPGFKGGLTLELVYHANDILKLPAGAGIAQVLFTRILQPANYTGKYQNQSVDPTHAIFEKA